MQVVRIIDSLPPIVTFGRLRLSMRSRIIIMNKEMAHIIGTTIDR